MNVKNWVSLALTTAGICLLREPFGKDIVYVWTKFAWGLFKLLYMFIPVDDL